MIAGKAMQIPLEAVAQDVGVLKDCLEHVSVQIRGNVRCNILYVLLCEPRCKLLRHLLLFWASLWTMEGLESVTLGSR